ncbi:hypothetical protein ACLOJK_004633 [Asimina triloba]
MATKPIPTQQRATHLTNSKVTPPALFIGISFNLDPESVDHPAASTFRSSKSGRPSTANERRHHPIFHGRPSQEDARLAPRSIQIQPSIHRSRRTDFRSMAATQIQMGRNLSRPASAGDGSATIGPPHRIHQAIPKSESCCWAALHPATI